MLPDKKDFTAILVGHYNPPTLDYVRAIEALKADGYGSIFLCPLSSGQKDHDVHIRAMTYILGIDSSKGITVCSAGLDKGLDGPGIRLWLENKYPKEKFKIAYLSTDPQDVGIPIVIGNVSKNIAIDPIYVPRHLSCQDGVADRIFRGSNESRSFSQLIWNYIRNHALYVPKENYASPTEIS